MSSGRINLNVAPSRVKKYRKHSWPSLMVQIQWNPALQPPQSYGHLVIMATFWGPYGKMAIHLLVNLLIWLNFWAYWWPYKWGSTVQCTLYIAPITFPVIAGIENVKMGRGRGLGGREKGRGFLPLPLPLPYPPPLPPTETETILWTRKYLNCGQEMNWSPVRKTRRFVPYLGEKA